MYRDRNGARYADPVRIPIEPAALAYRPFGGFRLLLAALVMWQHFAADLAPAALADAMAPYAVGSVAVLVFFALSGFVITEAADRVYRDRPLAFAGNRLLRIVPHFVLAVTLSFAALLVFSWWGGAHLWRSQPSYPADVTFKARNVVLNFIGIIPGIDRLIDYNVLDITWAVRVEMAYYLAVFLCLMVARTIRVRCGFAGVMLGGAMLFLLAMCGHGPGMLRFTPYFCFGAALYFALRGARTDRIAAAVALAALVWEFLTQTPAKLFAEAPDRASGAELMLLLVLLGLMTLLATRSTRRFRLVDSRLGAMTYPLYLYHEDVLVLVLTFFSGYSYAVFGTALILSVAAAWALMKLIDPAIDRWRDRLRGVRIRTH